MIKILSNIMSGFISLISFLAYPFTSFFNKNNFNYSKTHYKDSSLKQDKNILDNYNLAAQNPDINSESFNDCNDISGNSIFKEHTNKATALYIAVEKHLEHKVKFLLEDKLNFLSIEIINESVKNHPSGEPLLHLAVKNALVKNDPGILNLLLDHNEKLVDVNAQDLDRKTSLNIAFEYLLSTKNIETLPKTAEEIIKLLVIKGADLYINTPDQNKQTLLHDIIINGNKELLKFIVQYAKDIKDINIQNKFGKTALFIAVEKILDREAPEERELEIIQLLLDKGADVTIQDNDQDTILHKVLAKYDAKKDYHKKLINLLLASDKNIKNINTQDQYGRTPLFIAIQKELKEMIPVLFNHGANNITAQSDYNQIILEKIVKKSSVSILNFLIGHKINLIGKNFHDDYGNNLLDYAVAEGNENLVQHLVKKNPHLNTKNALHLAIQTAHERIAQYLIKKGANIEVLAFVRPHFNFNNTLAGASQFLIPYTPLQMATERGYENIVRSLIDKGANINQGIGTHRGTLLHIALKNGHKELVTYFIENRFDINAQDYKGETGLHIAVRKGDKELVQYLIEKGADINSQNYKGETGLHIAIEKGHQDLIQSLLDKGAYINQGINSGMGTPLWVAASKGDEKIVQYLIEEGAHINAKSFEGKTALHVAIENRQEQILQYLLDKRANINGGINSIIGPPLHIAAKTGQEKVVRSLIKRGASINAKSFEGKTALHVAIENRHEHIVQILIHKHADVNIGVNMIIGPPLHIAAKTGQEKVVQSLIERGASINAKSFEGKTALHVAIENGHEHIVKLLIHKNADINIGVNTIIGPPLHIAAGKGNEKLVQYLIERGADINAQNSKGETALHVAIENRHENVIQCLIDQDINIASISLDFAVRKGSEKLVEHLIKRGAHINAENFEGKTALHFAIESEQEHILQLLLNKGADINIGSNSLIGTPLHLAAKIGQEKVVRSLIKRGARINAQTVEGKTVLYIGIENGHEHIFQYLLNEGADINLGINSIIGTSLHIAAKTGQEKVVRHLIEEGALINAENYGKKTALQLAVENGHEGIINYLMDKDADINQEINSMTNTLLHSAVSKGNEKLVQQLIKKGANMNAQNFRGETPLHVAIKNGYGRIFRCLVDEGADINQGINSIVGTPLHVAVSKGNEEVVQDLIGKKANMDAQNSRGETALHVAIENGYDRIFRCLVDEGADINLGINSIVGTPLHVAVSKGNEEVVQELIGKKANMDAQNSRGETVLHVAIENGYDRIFRCLVDRGADINQGMSSRGEKLLHVAVRKGNEEVVQDLIDKGANMNAQNSGGETALHVAIENGYERIFRRLVDGGADINQGKMNGRGDTPLHIAVRKGQEKVVRYLIKKGANINSQSFEGITALHTAIICGSEDIMRYLIEKGANINAVNTRQETPLLTAIILYKTGSENIIQYLIEKGADVNVKSLYNGTALSYCLKESFDINLSLIEILLSAGAHIDSKFLLRKILGNNHYWALHAESIENSASVTSKVSFLIENYPELVLRILIMNFKERSQPSEEAIVLFLSMAQNALLNSTSTVEKVLRLTYAKRILRQLQALFGGFTKEMKSIDGAIDLNLLSPTLLENIRQYVLSLWNKPQFSSSDAIQTLKNSVEEKVAMFIVETCAYAAEHLPRVSEKENFTPLCTKNETKSSTDDLSPLDFHWFLLALSKNDLRYTKKEYEEKYIFNMFETIKNFYNHLECIVHAKGELAVDETVKINHKGSNFSGKDILPSSLKGKKSLEELETALDF